MPLTGQDFDRIIDLKSDNAYSGYFDNAKKNRIIREATNKAIDFKIASNDRIQVESDLFGIYKSEAVFTPTSNTLSLILAGSGITDYFRMMNVWAKFVVPFSGIYITNAAANSPLLITLSNDVNLATGEQVVISGVTTNTNTNGTRYVKKISPKKYQLYSDVNLLTPIVGNGVYAGTTGSISRVIYNHCKDYHSNRKGSMLNKPDLRNPRFELADTVMKIYPLTFACSEVKVDYVSTPVYIDVNDGTIDLYETYATRFIDLLADFVCREMGMSDRDTELANNSQIEISQP